METLLIICIAFLFIFEASKVLSVWIYKIRGWTDKIAWLLAVTVASPIILLAALYGIFESWWKSTQETEEEVNES